ncbi:nucleotide sugar dehydrogenase [Natronococcus sp. A-GB7]|uniref:nucleotide sugar dehydrogenase n=1 Tax=Natronococcus sp. A-GB7 TaxID=3037649 RepID=UPI00241D5ABE|nr:nucleotide sugar dehydrogenase [Natronococcus sp. A-GB7]MDG5819741.1 nucleotide sugar dehydrogenase [Natronococcus sp. A-GB7]
MSERNYKQRQLSRRSVSVSVVGLGYVGLPLAHAFDDAGYTVRGIDVDSSKIATLEAGIDPTGDVGDDAIAASGIDFVTEPTPVASSDYVIVAVPTPVDDLETPDLRLVERAGDSIGTGLRPGTTVVLESTVYPGATNEVFVPALERTSGLTAGEEFGVGYSPERTVPGDDRHGLRNVVKIVSGLTGETAAELAVLYESIVDAGVHLAPSIEVAETAKCVENTQRDINIALMNELAVTCDHIGVDTQAVLEAAGTKWNFHEYRPGLVGGHCIPVDPFYLIFESERNGFQPELIEKARAVNEYVPKHVAELTIKALNEARNVLAESRVLVLGLTYKPDVNDVRTSAIGGVVETLREYGIDVVGFDPCADDETIRAELELEVQSELSLRGFDGYVVGTPHSAFSRLQLDELGGGNGSVPVVIDVDGTFEDRVRGRDVIYRRL